MRWSEYRALRAADRSRAGKSGALGRAVVAIYRLGQYSYRATNPFLRLISTLVYVPIDAVFLRLLVGAELPREVDCGPGLALRHGGRGIIINPLVKMGSNVTLLHNVTIGNASPKKECPVIGNRVFVGAQSTIIGGIHLGDGCLVGAHSLVRSDVQPGQIVAGVPAREVGRR